MSRATRKKESKPKMRGWKGFLYPTKWKIVLFVILYFSNYLSFFGLVINYPIYYFYWNFSLTSFELLVLFIVHMTYLYLMSCVISRLLR